MNIEQIVKIAVDCRLRTHQGLGPGMLESACEAVIAALIRREGLRVETQVPISIKFDDIVIEQAFRQTFWLKANS